ncbi:MAG: hypothetical protein R2747_25045, partial [Pyrinomonadaceae bacterium]
PFRTMDLRENLYPAINRRAITTRVPAGHSFVSITFDHYQSLKVKKRKSEKVLAHCRTAFSLFHF